MKPTILKNLPIADGLGKGFDKIWLAPIWLSNLGVETISVLICASSEWEKNIEEVNLRMKIFKSSLEKELKSENIKRYKIIFSGAKNELPGDLPDICAEIESATKNNPNTILNLCLNYSGRKELAEAFKKMMKNEIELEQIHEGMIKKYLYHSDLSDIDLIIGTGNEQSLRGFMTWQSAFSKVVFLKKYWPDIEEGDLVNLLKLF
jgi:undecaprenyl diphosphate synthase